MYPFLHLLGDGSLFIFTSKQSQLFDVTKNKVIKELPDLPGLYRTYPNSGGSVMLPLHHQSAYKPEVMICGGGEIDRNWSRADDTCGRIKPLDPHPNWTTKHMPGGPRHMNEPIILLDGTVLWINGAHRGAQGFGAASGPALEALVYDPGADTWTSGGVSSVARMYHSVALMLLDGTILVAGSNPNEMPILEEDVDPSNPLKAFATEFRTEIYTPSYLLGNNAQRRPQDVQLETRVLVLGGKGFKVRFTTSQKPATTEIILYHGGFVTHSLHMGQVMLYLEHSVHRNVFRATSKLHRTHQEVTVKTPNIALAPGPYIVFVVVDGVPAVGEFVSVVQEK